jgi:hypothetical protein
MALAVTAADAPTMGHILAGGERMRRSITTTVAALVLVACAVVFSAAPAAAAVPDRCLRGQWRMPNERANTFLQNLIGNPAMRVKSGVLTAAFGRTEARYGSTHFVLHLTLGETRTLQASATFIFESRYSTRRGKLLLGRGQTELVISKFKATKGDTTATVPGPEPTTRTTPAGATPYVCTSTTLRWKVPFPGLDGTWAAFDRVR